MLIFVTTLQNWGPYNGNQSDSGMNAAKIKMKK